MPGRVFISCGQRDDEKETAQRVSALLEDRFGLVVYVAVTIQTFADIMIITDELRRADYYLFIDFLRPNSAIPVSLFTHQELALAHHLGFKDNAIFLRQKGTPMEGFIKYILGNPEEFTDRLDLLDKVERLVRERQWTPEYSRNLVIISVSCAGRSFYRDHTSPPVGGVPLQEIWQVQVRNKRPDNAAVGAVCVCSTIRENGGQPFISPDRSPLKWAGQASYDATLLPGDFGLIDVFALHEDVEGIFLHSLWDSAREPLIARAGDWVLTYKLYAQGFPLVDFSIGLKIGEAVKAGFQHVKAQLDQPTQIKDHAPDRTNQPVEGVWADAK